MPLRIGSLIKFSVWNGPADFLSYLGFFFFFFFFGGGGGGDWTGGTNDLQTSQLTAAFLAFSLERCDRFFGGVGGGGGGELGQRGLFSFAW